MIGKADWPSRLVEVVAKAVEAEVERLRAVRDGAVDHLTMILDNWETLEHWTDDPNELRGRLQNILTALGSE